MAFSFSAYCVHLLAHFLLAKLYEVSAVLMPLLQSRTERPRKLWPCLGSHSRVDPGTSKVWRPCKAPGPGRPPRTHTCPNPQPARGPGKDLQSGNHRVRNAPGRCELTMAAGNCTAQTPSSFQDGKYRRLARDYRGVHRGQSPHQSGISQDSWVSGTQFTSTYASSKPHFPEAYATARDLGASREPPGLSKKLPFLERSGRVAYQDVRAEFQNDGHLC